MIDLHSHILPGLDDGAKDMQMAIEMARAASADGISDVVCTPHTMDGVYNTTPEQVVQAMERLQEQLNKHEIALRLHPGQEVHIHYELLDSIREGRVLTLNNAGKYVLLELPVLTIPPYTEDLLYELWLSGITPIIAHPERNAVIRRDPSLIENWIEQGAIMQITAGSLTGQFRHEILKLCRSLIRKGYVSLISSDAHNMSTRLPVQSEAFSKVIRWTDTRYADELHRKASQVLQGIPMLAFTQSLEPPKRKTLLFWKT